MSEYKELADSFFEIATSPKEDRVENLVALQLAIADAKEIPNEVSELIMSIVNNLISEVEEKSPETESKSKFDDLLKRLDTKVSSMNDLSSKLDKFLSK